MPNCSESFLGRGNSKHESLRQGLVGMFEEQGSCGRWNSIARSQVSGHSTKHESS